MGCLDYLIRNAEGRVLGLDAEGVSPLHLVNHESHDQLCVKITKLLLANSSVEDRARALAVARYADHNGTLLRWTVYRDSSNIMQGCFGCIHALLDANVAEPASGWADFVSQQLFWIDM